MASMEPVSSWNSNSVLSVMELTKETMTVVPKNYIRPDQELSAPSDYSTLTTIPTIDMKKLALGETSDLELERLHSTFKAWGLIQVLLNRSEERRVGKECAYLCRSRWSPYH